MFATNHKLREMGVAYQSSGMRNWIGGFLGGYFAAAFCIFLFVVERWAHDAPTQPVRALGQIFQHNEHGWITYFTAFQSTGSALMFWSNFMAVGLAIAIMPKRDVRVRRLGKLPFGASWKNDDEHGIAQMSAVYGLVTAPLVIFLLGPIIVEYLTNHGIVLSL